MAVYMVYAIELLIWAVPHALVSVQSRHWQCLVVLNTPPPRQDGPASSCRVITQKPHQAVPAAFVVSSALLALQFFLHYDI